MEPIISKLIAVVSPEEAAQATPGLATQAQSFQLMMQQAAQLGSSTNPAVISGGGEPPLIASDFQEKRLAIAEDIAVAMRAGDEAKLAELHAAYAETNKLARGVAENDLKASFAHLSAPEVDPQLAKIPLGKFAKDLNPTTAKKVEEAFPTKIAIPPQSPEPHTERPDEEVPQLKPEPLDKSHSMNLPNEKVTITGDAAIFPGEEPSFTYVSPPEGFAAFAPAGQASPGASASDPLPSSSASHSSAVASGIMSPAIPVVSGGHASTISTTQPFKISTPSVGITMPAGAPVSPPSSSIPASSGGVAMHVGSPAAPPPPGNFAAPPPPGNFVAPPPPMNIPPPPPPGNFGVPPPGGSGIPRPERPNFPRYGMPEFGSGRAPVGAGGNVPDNYQPDQSGGTNWGMMEYLRQLDALRDEHLQSQPIQDLIQPNNTTQPNTLRRGENHGFVAPPGASQTMAYAENPSNPFGVPEPIWVSVTKDDRLGSVLQSMPKKAVDLYVATPPEEKLEMAKQLNEKTRVFLFTIDNKQAFISGTAMGRNTFDYLEGSLNKKIEEATEKGTASIDELMRQKSALNILRELSPDQREGYISLLEAETKPVAVN